MTVLVIRLDWFEKCVSDQTFCVNRTSFALDYLYQMKDMSYLIEAVKSLDVATRHSANSCIRMTEESGRPIQVWPPVSSAFSSTFSWQEIITMPRELSYSKTVRWSLFSMPLHPEKIRELFGRVKGCSSITELDQKLELNLTHGH